MSALDTLSLWNNFEYIAFYIMCTFQDEKRIYQNDNINITFLVLSFNTFHNQAWMVQMTTIATL